MKNFYTARQAQERLGITKSAFYYLLRKGTIRKVTPPGKTQGVYPRSEVDRFAASIKTLMEQYSSETSVFEQATLEDLPTEVEIDLSLFGQRGTTSLEKRIERMQKNPEGNYVLCNGEDIVGYICFYPIEQQAIEELITGQIKVVPIERFQTFDAGVPLHIYIYVVGVKPGFPADVSKHYGLRLLAGAVEVFKRMGERGVLIDTLYARSRTQVGIQLCRKLGMEGEELANEPGCYSFRMHVATSSSLLVQEYKAGYQEYLRAQARKRKK